MLEAISVPALLSRPRYINGGWFGTGLHWRRDEEVALAALCDKQAAIEKAAASLGRSPSSLAHRASDTGLILPREWRDLITKKRASIIPVPRQNLQYPYLVETRGEHADLLAVNAMVPRGLPDHLRADVCQEIMLALWERSISISELKANRLLVQKFVGHARKSNYEMGGYAMSLDAPMRDGRSWYDVIPDHGALE